MKFKKHLSIYSYFVNEIKNRGILLTLTGVTTTLTVYVYKETLLFAICSISSSSYIYTSITEIFSIYVKLISFISSQIILWYFFFHVLVFLASGLYNKEYYYLKFFFYLDSFVIILSTIFFNTIMFPFSCEFFLSFQNTIFKPLDFSFEAKITDYFSFYVALYYICSFYFQLFICLTFFFYTLDQKLQETKFFRKLFYFLFCALSILVNSFDVIGQILLCVSLIFFYELLVIKFLTTKNLTKSVQFF